MRVLNKTIAAIQNQGGVSIDLNGNTPKSGYMVALEGHEVKCQVKDLRVVLADYMATRKHLLRNPNLFLGGWVDDDTVYLDISEQHHDLKEARLLGRIRKQIAIYDVLSGKEVRL